MDNKQLCRICRSLSGATDNIQWDDDRVFKVAGKMFACTGTGRVSAISFKVDDERFLELTDQAGIIPAPYLARAKWIQVDPQVCSLSDNELEQLVRRSYELVVARLPKKTQRSLRQDD